VFVFAGIKMKAWL